MIVGFVPNDISLTFPIHAPLAFILMAPKVNHMKPLFINYINELLVRIVCIIAIDIWSTHWTGHGDKDLPGRNPNVHCRLPPEKLEIDPSPVYPFFSALRDHAFTKSSKAAIIHRMKVAPGLDEKTFK